MSTSYVYFLYRDASALDRWSLQEVKKRILVELPRFEVKRITAIPFYVGIGQRDRWLDHEREFLTGKPSYNRHKDALIARLLRDFGCIEKVKIVEGIHRSEAKQLEILLIRSIGMRQNGGPLTNLTRGGDGGADPSFIRWAKPNAKVIASAKQSAWYASEEGRAHIKSIMNRPETRAKLSDAGKRQMSDPVQLEANRQRGMLQYATQEARDAAGSRIRKTHANPEVKLKMRNAKLGKAPHNKGKKTGKPAWNAGLKTGPQSPEVRQRRSEVLTEVCKRPEIREMRSKAAKIRWAKVRARAQLDTAFDTFLAL